MALKRERFFAIFFAVLFLITSSFVTIAFIIANYESSHNSSNTPNLNSVQPASSSTATKLTNFTPTTSVPTLQIIDLKTGSGPVVQKGATVTVLYTGAIASSGVIFQSTASSAKPVTFTLSQVIPGWSEGMVGMKVGGIRRLLIPSALAYGANPPPGSGIPPNANLVFDITLLAIPKN